MYDLAKETGHITSDEEYLLIMGDRQDLRINLTTHDPDEMEAEINRHLVTLNENLHVGLGETELIKTRAYRVAKTESFHESFGIAATVVRDSEEDLGDEHDVTC